MKLASAECKTLAAVDAAFVDLRVACMEDSVLQILEGKKVDDDSFVPEVKRVIELSLECVGRAEVYTDPE